METLLNTGEKSQAFYDSSSDLIYLHYRKDSSVYLRILNPLDELSWRYLPNSYIQDPNTVHLNRDPQATILFRLGLGSSASLGVDNVELFPLSVTGLSFQLVGMVYEPFIFIPYLLGNNLSYLKYPYTIEIGSLVGLTFVTEDSIAFNSNDSYDRWHQWSGSLGTKFIRVRCFTQLIGGEYFTPSSGYKQVFIYDPFEYQYTVGDTENVQIITEPVAFRVSGSNAGQIIKTFEYEESRDFEQDTLPAFQISSGYNATITVVNT